jgi:hypothetical protein
MAFQTAITIKKTLDAVHRHEYVLPAIQREFVWKPQQIARIFDSLMVGYPIGSFLFWKVHRENTRKFKFYDFVRDYHQRDAPHCPALELTGDREVVAILDGQQRITALNIGLMGSHAEKETRKRWNNPDAFPAKRLYLNLLGEMQENEEGMRYDFRFLTEARAAQRDDTQCWFPVARIVDMREGGPDINEYLIGVGLSSQRGVFRTLDRLHALVFRDPIVSHYLEEDQDLDKVLNIFIRVNSGGTVLSYSDLLLSIATAQWKDLDARDSIHRLVDELNSTRDGFALSQDFVLKAGLMLSDVASVGFRVTNFNTENMALLEKNWPKIGQALRLATRIAADFGFNSQTLSADSALLPVAYYLFRRGLNESYRTSRHELEDRAQMRSWMVRSLLKPGVWGAGLDTTLTALRTAINEHGADCFPAKELEAALVKRGRSLRFEEDEVQDLAECSYADKRVFPLLSLMYPFVDLRNEFHVDHVFPAARFKHSKLRLAGITERDIPVLAEAVNQLPNLQLLEGARNQSKSDKLPAAWLREQYAADDARLAYCDRHQLGAVPEDLTGFSAFYETRKQRMIEKIRKILLEGSS